MTSKCRDICVVSRCVYTSLRLMMSTQIHYYLQVTDSTRTIWSFGLAATDNWVAIQWFGVKSAVRVFLADSSYNLKLILVGNGIDCLLLTINLLGT